MALNKDKDARISAIVRPLDVAGYEVDVHWTMLERTIDMWTKDYGAVELNPDFQRGHVWTPEQQQSFIENVIRRVVGVGGLIVRFNNPEFANGVMAKDSDLPRGFQCMDGLQRLTAAREFMAGNIKPFGLGLDDLADTYFDTRRLDYRFRVSVYSFRHRADVLMHYLTLNAGGTVHTQSEIDRVRRLLDDCAPDGGKQ